jgi:uncharacterized membrane protein
VRATILSALFMLSLTLTGCEEAPATKTGGAAGGGAVSKPAPPPEVPAGKKPPKGNQAIGPE